MNYETENLDFIDDIKPGEVLYDLGACEGRFSIYGAVNDVEIYSFEPDIDNYNVFNENIKLNALQKKITSFNVAVGDKEGIATFKIGQPWSGGHQKIVQFGDYKREDLDFDFKKEVKVRLVSLDEFIEANSLKLPDYLKIDIDGSEMPFIQGAKKTLREGRVKKIIFELSTSDPLFQDIISILDNLGFLEQKRYHVPNEEHLFNIIFQRKTA
ncbi:MAG: FkbM family methyltransferase [Flavobacteriales bacterium]|nr:FkbM family methyltransferase [Flavobacteriales bacterium]